MGFSGQDLPQTVPSVQMRVRCFRQLEHQTEGKVPNCTLLSFELGFLREAFTPSPPPRPSSVTNPDQGTTLCQTLNLPLQTDYKLTLSDGQPSRNSHSSMDKNLGQHRNYIFFILFYFFPLPFLKAHGTQFLGIPPYGDSLGSTSRTLVVFITLNFLYYQVYKGTRFNSKGCQLRKNNVLGL